jgi:nucleoside-diphosphate-sugar epimerase
VLGKFDLVLHMGACSSTTERDAGFLFRNDFEFTRDLADWALAKSFNRFNGLPRAYGETVETVLSFTAQIHPAEAGC